MRTLPAVRAWCPGRRAEWRLPGIQALLARCVLMNLAVVLAGSQPLLAQAKARAESVPLVSEWLADAAAGVAEAQRHFGRGDATGGRATLLRVYLDRFEGVEAYYGASGAHATPELEQRVNAAEASFHALLRPDFPAGLAASRAAVLRTEIEQIARVAAATGSAHVRALPRRSNGPVPEGFSPGGSRTSGLTAGPVRSVEIRRVLDQLEQAAEVMADDRSAALARVERAYLEGFEPIEARLPGELVNRIERTIHLQLRPALAAGEIELADTALAELHVDLRQADSFLAGGGSFWFGAANSFAIVVREGLEAVLLIAALLAYLTATGAGRRPRRQLYAGLVAGVAASLGTWAIARTLLPISGSHRELVEGLTALVAVGVLLYVSHWLFQKAYVQDWKGYLRQHAGLAVARGSAFAMAMLAFAAVYREGFETVLFFQALRYDVGPSAILTGFLPGALVILGLGFGIVRFGVKLPLGRVFAVTNGILLYLAFAFLGKGIYNLQEAGVFSPTPLGWVPDRQVLRQLFGVYPIAQTLAGQLAFIAVVGITYWVYRLRVGAQPNGPVLH